MPVNDYGNDRQADKKKKRDQEIKQRMRPADEDQSEKRICSQAIHFPIPHPSYLLNLPLLQTRCVPQCVQLLCHFHPTFCSYLWCHWKMTKLGPQQNFLFRTPQAENCPPFTLLALFHPAVAKLYYMRVHSRRSVPDLVNSFLCAVYPLFRTYKRRKNNEV